MPLRQKLVDPMQKSIPRNPKYEDIRPTIDTGASLSKYLKKMEEFREDFRVRDNEIFKRIKLSTFVQLLVQIYEERIRTQTIETFDRISSDQGDVQQITSDFGDVAVSEFSSTARPTLEKLVKGIGEFDSGVFDQHNDHVGSKSAGEALVEKDSPYLLLDLRDRDEYDACHIISALNYPVAMLSRCVNFETTEMRTYRNQPGKVIILYDEDEHTGPNAVTTLVQRGYCNVYLLSGGLKVAWKRFPEGLIIGKMPASIQVALRSQQRSRSTGFTNNRISSAGSTINNRAIIPSPPSAVGFCGKTRVIYCEPGSRDSEDGMEDFTPEDIMKLNVKLEQGMDDVRSICSSHTRSAVSSARCTTCNSATVKKPFR